MTEGDEYGTYIVNMIKSIEDPSKERYCLITIIQDFHLVKLSSKHRQKYNITYGIATTDVAIAMQFDSLNFLNIDIAVSNIKMMYIKKRLEYLNQILHKAQNFKNEALKDLYDHNEQAKLYIKDFREITLHSLDGSKNFVITRMPSQM